MLKNNTSLKKLTLYININYDIIVEGLKYNKRIEYLNLSKSKINLNQLFRILYYNKIIKSLKFTLYSSEMYDKNKTNYYKDVNNYFYCIDLIKKV